VKQVNTLITFEYVSKDEQLQSIPKKLTLDPSKARVLGELHKTVYDTRRIGNRQIFAFFIEYNGVEYGSTSMTQTQFYELRTQKCCAKKRKRIHVSQFSKQFR
jgi:hypothetical protein